MTKPPPGYKTRRERMGQGPNVRMKHTKVKTARGRKISSKLWLERQLNDPYVIEAKRRGYRSRAAFKLIELNEKFHFLKPGGRIIDLGATPGGWSQVAAEIVLKGKRNRIGKVVALDIQAMESLPDVTFFLKDFLDDDAPNVLKTALGGKADVVMSDMAAKATGHTRTDHLRIMGLCETALDFAKDVLNEGGTFVAKVLKGGTEDDLLMAMKKDFKTVRHAKPPASRQNSAEMYVVALEFTGNAKENTKQATENAKITSNQ